MPNPSIRRLALFVFCVGCMVMSGCAGSAPDVTQTPQETAASTMAAATQVPSQPPTATPPAQPTPTSSPAPTQTAIFTPTPTPFRTANGYLPGKYNTGGCVNYSSFLDTGYYAQVKFCVWYIEILRNGKMRVTVSWDVDYNAEGLKMSVIKADDDTNKNMFMVDNLGNRYDHIETGGDTDDAVVFWGDTLMKGWFLFPEPKPGVTAFTFVDWDTRQMIVNMLLEDPMPLTEETVSLLQHPYTIVYKSDIWKMEPGESGEFILTNLKNEKCQISERAPGQPEGKLKSKLEIGQTTFDIYGWLDSDQGMGYRDYQAISGLDGLDPQQPMILRAAIPLADQDMCLDEISGILFSLSEPVGNSD